MRILASNEISTLDVMCHILVMPRVGSITADLTAAYYMQLEAVIRSDTGMYKSMSLSLSSHHYNYVFYVLCVVCIACIGFMRISLHSSP